MDLLVTYDVDVTTPAGERRLARVAAVCERYGVRVQYSVFECRLSEASYVRLVGDLSDEMDPRVDSINIYRLAGAASECRFALGRSPSREPGQPWVL